MKNIRCWSIRIDICPSVRWTGFRNHGFCIGFLGLLVLYTWLEVGNRCSNDNIALVVIQWLLNVYLIKWSSELFKFVAVCPCIMLFFCDKTASKEKVLSKVSNIVIGWSGRQFIYLLRSITLIDMDIIAPLIILRALFLTLSSTCDLSLCGGAVFQEWCLMHYIENICWFESMSEFILRVVIEI